LPSRPRSRLIGRNLPALHRPYYFMPELETESVVLIWIALGVCSAAAVWVVRLFRMLNRLIAEQRERVEADV